MVSVNSTATDNINTIRQTRAGETTDKAQQALTGSLDDFLKLLTTQLQNQDPTDPMKAENFTQQIASLSAVEQQINTNKTLESILAALGGSQIGNSVSYIGKQVDATGKTGTLAQGNAFFGYTLGSAAADKVTVTISDSTGKAVYTGEGSKLAGRNVVQWDGRNSFTGQTMADGTYTLSVVAKDAAGSDIAATPFTTGIVTAVTMKDGQAKLALGEIEVAINDVQSVR